MKRFFKHKKLLQSGFVHHLAPILVVVFLGVISSSFVYFHGKAAQNWNGALSVGPSNSGYCLDAPILSQNKYVVLNKCVKTSTNQHWQRVADGTVTVSGKTLSAFRIQTYARGVNLCVDDFRGSTVQGKNNPMLLWGCTAGDNAERFYWYGDGHQLVNVASKLCMDDVGASRNPNNTIDMYKCKPTSTPNNGIANQDWFEIANTSTPTTPLQPVNPSPVPAPAPNPTPGTQTWTGALQLGLKRTLCLENQGNATETSITVQTNTCKNTNAQKWTRVPLTTTTFMLKSATGTCVQDPNLMVGTTASNRVHVDTAPCNSADPSVVWTWAYKGTGINTDASVRPNAHELMNTKSKGCINDPANILTAPQYQIVYSCAANTSNEQWFEAAL